MAILIETQKDLRSVYEQPFCYLCGKTIVEGDDLNDDHVPPSGIFNPSDRNVPLILRTHRACNSAQSPGDQVIAQLVGLIRGRVPSEKDRKLDIRVHDIEPGKSTAVLRGQELEQIVFRWVRGFHAALYGEPLSPATAFKMILPFPQMKQDGEILKPDPIPAPYQAFFETITESQATGRVDQIISRNGKCRYSCVWTQEDGGGRWFCVYRLDLYNWSELGDINNYERRECVGAYIRPDRSAPITAMKVPRSE